jgi:dGTP triphosphohydrolase
VVVAQKIERKGCGLNLTRETLQGILNHSKGAEKITINDSLPHEYNIVMLSDKISYVFSDVQDIQRFRLKYDQNELNKMLDNFGFNQRKRIAKCMLNLIQESAEKGKISFENSEIAEGFKVLKEWMYNNIYKNLNNRKLLSSIMNMLYDQLLELENKIGVCPAVFIALMTDDDVMEINNKLCSLSNLEINDFSYFGAMEIINNLFDKSIDFTNPDLNW